MEGRLGAVRRLRKEWAEVERNGEDGETVLVPDAETLLKWRAFVRGPEGTHYAGGVYELELKAGLDYPMAPPKVRFVTKVFHPNVHERTGEVCVDVLKGEWSPAWTLAAATQAIRSVLAQPNADSPLNCDAGNLIRAGDIKGFHDVVDRYVADFALRDMPTRHQLQNQETTTPTVAGGDKSSGSCYWLVPVLAFAVFVLYGSLVDPTDDPLLSGP